jgi:hypothetical protein
MEIDMVDNPPVPARATRRRPRGRGIRVRTGCSACRQRHLKCDETHPICRACQKASRDCVYPQLQRHKDTTQGATADTTGDEVTVVATPQQSEASSKSTRHHTNEVSLPEVDPAPTIADTVAPTIGDVDNVESTETEKPGPVAENLTGSLRPRGGRNPLYSVENTTYLTEGVFDFGDPNSDLEFPDVYDAELFGISPEASFGGWPTVSAEAASQWWFNLLASDIINNQPMVLNNTGPHQRYGTTSDTCAPGEISSSSTLIQDYVQHATGTVNNAVILTDLEIQLLHHYVMHLSGWIDVTEPDTQFAVIVPNLALTNQGLASAILALSSLHLSLEFKPTCSHSSLSIDPTTAVQYYNDTLHYLQHAMGDADFLRSDELLATVLIISMFEMIEMKSLDQGEHFRHLQGVFWIQRSQVIHGESQGLKQRIWCKSLIYRACIVGCHSGAGNADWNCHTKLPRRPFSSRSISLASKARADPSAVALLEHHVSYVVHIPFLICSYSTDVAIKLTLCN